MDFDFKIYNFQTGLVGILENYVSVIWSTVANDIGECQIIAPLNENNLKLLVEDNVVMNPNPITVLSNDGQMLKNRKVYEAAIILAVEIDEAEKTITVKANTLEHLLTYFVLGENAYNDNEVNRVTVIAETFSRTGTQPLDGILTCVTPEVYPLENSPQTVDMRFQNMYTPIADCYAQEVPEGDVVFSYGVFLNPTLRPYTPRVVAETVVFESADRSVFHNPQDVPVIFSDEFETLHKFRSESDNSEFVSQLVIYDSMDYNDYTVVYYPDYSDALPGEIDPLTLRQVPVEISNVKREDYSSQTAYENALIAKAVTKTVSKVKNYSFEVPADSRYQYKRDFYKGDRVLLRIKKYNLDLSAEVAAATETFDSTGYNCEITFGNLKDTLAQRLNKRLR